jgi:hypothetical protein
MSSQPMSLALSNLSVSRKPGIMLSSTADSKTGGFMKPLRSVKNQ